MLLKRFDKEGNKYYISAFNGEKIVIEYRSPIKHKTYIPKDQRPEKVEKEIVHSPGTEYKASKSERNEKDELANIKRSVLVGDYKIMLRMKPKDRDKKEFIKVCKRLNINPWPLLEHEIVITNNQIL